MKLNIYLIGAFFGMLILASCGKQVMMKLPFLKMIHGIGDTFRRGDKRKGNISGK